MIAAVIPIKPFGVAKARLSPVLGASDRSRLGRAVAARTARLCEDAGAEVTVVTGDEGVALWAKAKGLAVTREDPDVGTGLDGAAACGARDAHRRGLRWVIVHADLPTATAVDFEAVLAAASQNPVIVPSYDGGTNLIAAGGDEFAFSYGSGSFHRHLAAMPHATVLTAPRLALDLDTPQDLERSLTTPSGAWLREVLGFQEPGP